MRKIHFFNKERLKAFQYWPQVITLLLIGMAFIIYRYLAYYNTWSDDAYVSAYVVNVAPQVSGPISRIYVKDNQAVKKGDKLIEIDPRPYRYAMNEALAKLHLKKTNYDNGKFAIQVAQDNLKQAQSKLALSRDHRQRYQTLEQTGALAKIQLIDVEAKIKEQEALVFAAENMLKMAQKKLDYNEVRAAKAAYDRSRYLYNHTTLVSPVDGYVTNFNLLIGQYVPKGEGLFALVDTNRWWVVTRYRETSIRLIQPGDKARITLTMYPGKVFHGHVESISWGINRVHSGPVTDSTLVYMKPTEDWIRIAQRFPVRIVFDDLSSEYPLRIGASAATRTYRQ